MVGQRMRRAELSVPRIRFFSGSALETATLVARRHQAGYSLGTLPNARDVLPYLRRIAWRWLGRPGHRNHLVAANAIQRTERRRAPPIATQGFSKPRASGGMADAGDLKSEKATESEPE